jgi:short-subunit dehydrogenase
MSIYISGATGYLGSLLSKHLAKIGKNLILGGRNQKKLKLLQSSLRENHKLLNFEIVACNLEEIDSWENAKKSLEKFEVAAYINCSGIQGKIDFGKNINQNEFQKVFNVNLFSSIYFTNYFINRLEEKKDLTIIHFSGGGATIARPLFMPYSLSKTALIRFVENIASENLDSKIRINAIAPGTLPSKMQEEIANNHLTSRVDEGKIACNSLKNPEFNHSNLLKLCDFLLSDLSDGINGKLISAQWDKWEDWPEHILDLQGSDLYTLRRIVGRDRHKKWGDKT